MNPNLSEAETEKSGKPSRKHDLLLVLAVLAASVLLFIGKKLHFSTPPATAVVQIDQKTLFFDLNEDNDVILTNSNGETNHLIIKDGAVHMEDASCPDKNCVQQGTISKTGQTIVCLPNHVIVTLTTTSKHL